MAILPHNEEAVFERFTFTWPRMHMEITLFAANHAQEQFNIDLEGGLQSTEPKESRGAAIYNLRADITGRTSSDLRYIRVG